MNMQCISASVVDFSKPICLDAQVPMKIVPERIELLPWGSWTTQAQTLPDRGPWRVHEPLPPFRLALQAQNVTVSFNSNEKFMVGVRLFRPVDLLDISSASLEGTTIQQVLRAARLFPSHFPLP
jgi:hypothetical protein